MISLLATYLQRNVQLMARVLVERLQVLAAVLQVALLLEQHQAVLGRLDLFAASLIQLARQPFDLPAHRLLLGHCHGVVVVVVVAPLEFHYARVCIPGRDLDERAIRSIRGRVTLGLNTM